jgi:hypothetical protein
MTQLYDIHGMEETKGARGVRKYRAGHFTLLFSMTLGVI